MREIDASEISKLVSNLYQDANFHLPDEVINAYKDALEWEESDLGKEVLETLIKNAEVASSEHVPLCQDTGLAVVFAEVGRDAHITGSTLREAVDRGVSDAVREGSLRASVVSDPCFTRINTGDNTPAMLHTEIVEGDGISLAVLPKGAGSENMSRLAMLKPSDGKDALVRFAVETVEQAGASACPPVFLGIGVGGTMDIAAILSKKALLRPAGTGNSDQDLLSLEQEIFKRVNELGIGPAGFGGRVTCLGVALEDFPCHIASLPVAVNIQCNSARKAEGAI